MLPLDKHCYEYATLFRRFLSSCYLTPNDGVRGWDKSFEWIYLASSILNVTAQPDRFDGYKHCDIIQGHMEEEGKLYSDLAKQIAVFNFVWCGFESMAKNATVYLPEDTQKKYRNSIVMRSVEYLNIAYDYDFLPIPLYHETLEALKNAIQKHKGYDLKELTKNDNDVCFMAEGLSIVRSIRNSFAHGSAEVPKIKELTRSEVDTDPFVHIELVQLSTRIVLFSIQALLISYIREEGFLEGLWNEDNIGRFDQSLIDLIGNVHVTESDEYLMPSPEEWFEL